jgi:hypothetical protein
VQNQSQTRRSVLDVTQLAILDLSKTIKAIDVKSLVHDPGFQNASMRVEQLSLADYNIYQGRAL